MAQASHTELKKSLGLIGLTIYGVGNMLGAGIYGLVGKAAGEMGNAVWIAFIASMVAAGLTGLSYASLGSRYPKAAGAAYITHRAFALPMLAYVVGLAIMASGLTSMATTAQVFAGYFLDLTQLGDAAVARNLVCVSLIIILGAVNFWGLKEAAWVNMVCTLVETGGLLLVVAVGWSYWGSVDYFDATSINNPSGELSAGLILSGAILTFYSFIGFEDLLNVSEEVKNPQTTFPIALVSALTIAALIYLAICITVVSVIPHAELAASSAPLAAVMKVAAPWFHPKIFSAVALFAVTNTSLLNYIMGSRLAYGMAKQGLLPQLLARLHTARQTPHIAICILGIIVIALILIGDIKDLAKATSILLLCSFTVVNASLIRLQRKVDEAKGRFEVPTIIPAGGVLVCLAMIGNEIVTAFKNDTTTPLTIAAVIIATIATLYLMLRPKNVEMD